MMRFQIQLKRVSGISGGTYLEDEENSDVKFCGWGFNATINSIFDIKAHNYNKFTISIFDKPGPNRQCFTIHGDTLRIGGKGQYILTSTRYSDLFHRILSFNKRLWFEVEYE